MAPEYFWLFRVFVKILIETPWWLLWSPKAISIIIGSRWDMFMYTICIFSTHFKILVSIDILYDYLIKEFFMSLMGCAVVTLKKYSVFLTLVVFSSCWARIVMYLSIWHVHYLNSSCRTSDNYSNNWVEEI